MKTKKRGSFTLVELLAVISIIAILASLLLPTLHHAKNMTKSADCMNKLKNISLTTLAYADSYNGYAPYDEQYVNNSFYSLWIMDIAVEMGLFKSLYNAYTAAHVKMGQPKRFDIFTCVASKYGTIADCYPTDQPRCAFNYTINHALTGRAGTPVGIGHPLNKLHYPSRNLLFFDVDPQKGYGTITDIRYVHKGYSTTCRADPRHDGKVNAAYADGHAVSKPLAPNLPTVRTSNDGYVWEGAKPDFTQWY